VHDQLCLKVILVSRGRFALGWEGYDSPAAVEAINDLYRLKLRLWQNLDLPAVKLVKKVRVGSEKTQRSRRNGCGIACKSRKERAIRTFPQPRQRRVRGYISNVSTIDPKVTFLNGLTRRAILPDPKQRSHGLSWISTG